jgi:nickel-type superoxide dismutase maturation protease
MRSASYYEIFLHLFGYYECYRIEGDSMTPTLKNGQRVLVKIAANLQIGDIVVAKHPFRKTPIIKRITEFSTGGKLFLSGDNPEESTDSRTFGEIPAADILGKVICRLD